MRWAMIAIIGWLSTIELAVALPISAGHAVVEITPPIDVEPGGVLAVPGKERRYTRVNQSAEARCLVLKVGDVSLAIVSIDLLGVGKEFVERVQAETARRAKIPAEHVRICATHTHSMPTFKPLRMHGALPEGYMKKVETLVVDGILKAQADLAPARLEAGSAIATDANFNRTTKVWKTEDQFNKDSNDTERWLDRTVHVLRWRRADKTDIVLYHFAAHPVCFRDDPGAGPDWPGLVNRQLRGRDKVEPLFLQGHCGDVNPGDGKTFLGNPEDVSKSVVAAITQALKNAKAIDVPALVIRVRPFDLPFDMERFKKEIARYEANPEECLKAKGWMKNRLFADHWFEASKKWDPLKKSQPVTLSAVQLGTVALLFHPGELYSAYGLMIRRDSPFASTLVVGYADDLVGYLPDPKAYDDEEYAATTVPKIIQIPPFTPTATQKLYHASVELLNDLKTRR